MVCFLRGGEKKDFSNDNVIQEDPELCLKNIWTFDAQKPKTETATKHDDAEIPVHLWNKALEQKLQRKLTQGEMQSLNILRKASIYIWRKKITSCFCQWLRCQVCHHYNIIKQYPSHAIGQEFTTKPCKTKCKPVSKGLIVWIDKKYCWGKSGKYNQWFKNTYKIGSRMEQDVKESRIAGVDCIVRSCRATEWSWEDGSRPYFWRWGNKWWREARDGAKVRIKGILPECKDKTRLPKEKDEVQKIKEKIGKVRKRRYIASGQVKSLTSYFHVPKGESDIRMVYNATSSGLNEVTFAPWFALPTIESHLRGVEAGTYMADNDVGDMFLNFLLDKNIRAYAGIDISGLFPEESNKGILWERWERLLMGFTASPYLAGRDMKRIEMRIKGIKEDRKNVFNWDKSVENLPGMKDYDTSKPWIYKARQDGKIAADIFIYVDDVRPTAPSWSECWQASHRVGTMLTWHGLQDAARKRREPSQEAGAWAGSILHSNNDQVTALISNEKWEKTKLWIKWLSATVFKGDKADFVLLQKCRGYLIYVSRTYRPMIPYLRGLHKSIDSWRPFQDCDGWKLSESELRAEIEQGRTWKYTNDDRESIAVVNLVPRMKKDVMALKTLTKATFPPKVIRRKKKTSTVCYGFGDASGLGFGNCIEVEGVQYAKFGSWNKEVESKHSNYKELRNLVNAIEEAIDKGILKDCELFMFTDNFTAESAYYNGGSNTSKELDCLILSLWKTQMKGTLILHVIHIAGTRMIESGIDGLSRGDKTEGISRGMDILNFVPLHLSPVRRSPLVRDWVNSWIDLKVEDWKWMSTDDWYNSTLLDGNFIWDIAPAAGETAVELLCAHVHATPTAFHIILIPRIATQFWRKQLSKVSDVILTIKPLHSFWGATMHEPLLTAFCFPLLPPSPRFKPWRLRNTRLVGQVRDDVHRLQRDGHKVDWNCLRKLLKSARSLPTLSTSMARSLLQD